MNVAPKWQSQPAFGDHAEQFGRLAALCLNLEVKTFPKPGLVSHIDSGAHSDMDAELLHRSADTLRPFFRDLALAGAAGAGMDRLRAIGIAAERAMLAATGGVNTHRGAIFGMGLLCAAAGYRNARGLRKPLGRLIESAGAKRSCRARYVFAATAPQPHDAMAPAAQEPRRPAVTAQSMILPFPHCTRRAISRLTTTRPCAFMPA